MKTIDKISFLNSKVCAVIHGPCTMRIIRLWESWNRPKSSSSLDAEGEGQFFAKLITLPLYFKAMSHRLRRPQIFSHIKLSSIFYTVQVFLDHEFWQPWASDKTLSGYLYCIAGTLRPTMSTVASLKTDIDLTRQEDTLVASLPSSEESQFIKYPCSF